MYEWADGGGGGLFGTIHETFVLIKFCVVVREIQNGTDETEKKLQ